MKTKNWIAIACFVVLAAAAFYIVVTEERSKQTINLEEAKFAIKDTSAIDSIFIARKDGSTALLTRYAGNRWQINKKTLADKALMAMLMRTIHDVDVRRPLNSAERKEVIKAMATQHTKVDIYIQGEIVKSYYVGHEADDNQGSYLLTTGAEQPYVVHIPGFDGILSPRYDVREKSWRDKQIFFTTPQKLKSVTVTYFQEPEKNFQILFDKGKFSIPTVTDPDTLQTEQYLEFMNSVFIEQFKADFTEKELDSLKLVKPIMSINLKNIGDTEGETMTVYPPNNTSYTYVYLNKTKEYASFQLHLLQRLMAAKTDLIRKGKNILIEPKRTN
jgi:hypothetical protein